MALSTHKLNGEHRAVRHTVSVARDFSRTPGPRFIRQGNWSGEKFRSLLKRKLEAHEFLLVDLDGTRGYGSSFLDEAFGGLVREGVLSKEDARRRVEIRSDEDPTYKVEAERAIAVAEPRH